MPTVEILTDRDALRTLVARMPPIQQEQYEDLRCLELESAFPGRRMIVFDLREGQPVNLDELLFTDFSMPRGGEPTAEYRFQYDGKFHQTRVGMVPTRFAHREVYLSIPQKFEFRWGGRKVDGKVSFQPHFALLIKTRHKLLHRVDGATYCVSLRRFQTDFPHAADQVRF